VPSMPLQNSHHHESVSDDPPAIPITDDAATADQPLTEIVEYPSAASNHLLSLPVGSALMWLALPVLGEQALLMLVGLVDTFLAGTVGKEATAAIGLASQVSWLAGLLFGFIGVGATALVARHVGMGLVSKANHFSNQALSAAVIMGALEFALIYLLAPFLPRLLDWGPEPARIVVQYLRIDSAGYILASITVIAAACWRGGGDTRTPLYVMIVVNFVNILVSAGLRFGWGGLPSLGVAGIAIGTLVARLIGGLIVIGLLLHGRSGIRFRAQDLRFRRESMRRILHVGIPAGLDGIFLWAGQFCFLIIISQLATGDEQAAILAAHFVGIRVESLSYLPAFAWATGAATLVGQFLGAGDRLKARRSGHLAAVQSAVLCMAMGVVYFLFAPQIYALFNASADLERVTRIGVPALRGLAFFQLPLALMIVYTNALRGAGDTRYPLLYTLLGMVLVRLPLAYLCGVVWKGGLLGAWVGMFADMTVRAALTTVRFLRGKWEHIKI
jgi:MATE family multidrug resistance protein